MWFERLIPKFRSASESARSLAIHDSPVPVITRSLKSLWQSDVLLGASVGAATSGLLVVLALVVAPLLDGSPRQATADARTGTANLPAPARAAESRATDDDRAAKRDRAAVTRRDDTASLPAPSAADDDPRRSADAPDRQITPIPVSPATTITKVPVVPGLSAPSAGPSSAGAASAITPATVRGPACGCACAPPPSAARAASPSCA